jgi:hypothetical protein
MAAKIEQQTARMAKEAEERKNASEECSKHWNERKKSFESYIMSIIQSSPDISIETIEALQLEMHKLAYDWLKESENNILEHMFGNEVDEL